MESDCSKLQLLNVVATQHDLPFKDANLDPNIIHLNGTVF